MARIVVIADVPNWAWARKAEQLKKHVREHHVDVIYTTQDTLPWGYDLYHTFEFPQMTYLGPHGLRAVTGITAHVWRTWEGRPYPNTLQAWADAASAIHANSKMLQEEIGQRLGRQIHYVPNGVDETFFYRERPRASSKLVVGWVGKPNPRKGRWIVQEACQLAGVEFRPVERSSQSALSALEMRQFYQDIHVLAVASDMDGTPNPALEAAACECAVVSNRIGNMPEFIVDGVNGIFVERDAQSMAEALRGLAANVDRAVTMGQNARATVEQGWTWKHQSQNYVELWNAALAEPTQKLGT